MAPAPGKLAAQPDERRSHRRYPVGLGLRYKLYGSSTIPREGSGMTQDLSAGGVFFRADQALPAGVAVELWVDWPAHVNGASFLRLTISGQIVRSAENGIGVRILHSEFLANSTMVAS